MIIHEDLLQGSDAWHQFRLEHFGASEAAAMLGLSKTVTRTELLHAKSTGIAKEYSDWVQKNILDYGHEVEITARKLMAAQIGESLFPVTCSDGIYSCSCDGLTMDEATAWEHKQYNKEYFDMVSRGVVPEEHMPQCQQVLMVTGAEKLIFTISDGTEENMVSTAVPPCLEWFERIRATWAQFEIDLANYVPVRIAEKPIADAITDLPVLFVQAKGEITAHNMEAFGKSLAISLKNTRAIVLTTDQDYSNAEAAAKLYRETCKKLVLVKEAVLAQATTIGEATRMIDSWHEDLRVTALKLEKDVTEKKEAQKLLIITQARTAYIEHVAALESEIKPIALDLPMPEFALSLKNKRLISAWHEAVNTLLANSKVKADLAAKDVREKLTWCKDTSAGFAFLFNDLSQIITKPFEDFKLLVTSRIEAHKVSEAAKLEAEREKIRIEEEAKAKAKIEAEALAENLRVEHEKQHQESLRVALEEETAKAKRIQDDLQAAKSWKVKHEIEQTEVEVQPTSIDSGRVDVLGSTEKAPEAADEIRNITDEQVITAMADEFDITYDESCALIRRVAANLIEGE